MNRAIVLALAVLLVAAACGGGDEPVATPSPAPSPTAGATATPAPTPEVSAEEACPPAAVMRKEKGEASTYLDTGWEVGEVICWTDAAGEAGYRLHGTVDYWVPPPRWRCGETPPAVSPLTDPVTSPAPEPGFLQDLPANTTRFQLPRHPDPRVRLRAYEFRIEALDSDGNVIVVGGGSLTRDAFCE